MRPRRMLGARRPRRVRATSCSTAIVPRSSTRSPPTGSGPRWRPTLPSCGRRSATSTDTKSAGCGRACIRHEFPKAEYAGRVDALRRRYVLLKLPVALWTLTRELDRNRAAPSVPVRLRAVSRRGISYRSCPTAIPAIKVLLLPKDTNALGTIFGGVILSHIDLASAVEARKHGARRFVTKAMRAVEFVAPVHVGDIVNFYCETAAGGTHVGDGAGIGRSRALERRQRASRSSHRGRSRPGVRGRTGTPVPHRRRPASRAARRARRRRDTSGRPMPGTRPVPASREVERGAASRSKGRIGPRGSD